MEKHNKKLLTRVSFTLVELLTVITVIAIMASLLFPVLVKVKAATKSIKCSGNMRQVGISFGMYTGDNNSFFPPTAPGVDSDGTTIKWPVLVNVYISNDPPTYLYFKYKGGVTSKPKNEDIVWRCPALDYSSLPIHPYYVSYGYNYSYVGGLNLSTDLQGSPARVEQIQKTSKTLLNGDSFNDPTFTLGYYMLSSNRVAGRHPSINGEIRSENSRTNILWVDGHVSNEKRAYIVPSSDGFYDNWCKISN